ncbi:hypothetical protein D3C75_803880 [compost metagenome]
MVGEQLGHHARQHQQVVALADDGGGGHIALAVDRDGAAVPQALQIAVEARLRGAERRVEHVGHLDKLIERDALLLQLQGGTHQPGQGLGEPGLLAQIPRHLHVLVKPQHQIDLAARQLRFR